MFSAHAVPARPRLTTRTNPKRRPRSPRGRSSKRPPEGETPRFAEPGALDRVGQPARTAGLLIARDVSSPPFYGEEIRIIYALERKRKLSETHAYSGNRRTATSITFSNCLPRPVSVNCFQSGNSNEMGAHSGAPCGQGYSVF